MPQQEDNPTQLAAEAAKAVSKVVTLKERELIILSAIEKALAQEHFKDHIPKGLNY